MSMPIFPDHGLDLTKEKALNMLLGSIAMEELALSHIMNAEGEKLQYILGTLPDCHGTAATTQELLQVNESIAQLMEHVNHSQMLLKGKLAQVLQAMDGMQSCCQHCPHTICVLCACQDECWKKGDCLSWKPIYRRGEAPLCAQGCTAIKLPQECGQIQVEYSFQIRPCQREQISIGVYLAMGGERHEITTLDEFPFLMDTPITLSGNFLLPPDMRDSPGASTLSFCLREPCSAVVKNATVSLICLPCTVDQGVGKKCKI